MEVITAQEDKWGGGGGGGGVNKKKKKVSHGPEAGDLLKNI